MSLKIEEVTKEKFSKFGDFINPYSVESTDINMNTTKSYFDLEGACLKIHHYSYHFFYLFYCDEEKK